MSAHTESSSVGIPFSTGTALSTPYSTGIALPTPSSTVATPALSTNDLIGVWELKWRRNSEAPERYGQLHVQTGSAIFIIESLYDIEQAVSVREGEGGVFVNGSDPVTIKGTDVVVPRYIKDDLFFNWNSEQLQIRALNSEKEWESVQLISAPRSSLHDPLRTVDLNGKWSIKMFDDTAVLEITDTQGVLVIEHKICIQEKMSWSIISREAHFQTRELTFCRTSVRPPRYSPDEFRFILREDGTCCDIQMRDEDYVKEWLPVMGKKGAE